MEDKLKFLAHIHNYQNFDPDYVRKNWNKVIRALIDVSQSIYDSKIKLQEGEVFIETLIIKMIYASKSVIDISFGAEIPFFNTNRKVEFIDTPSMYILTRSIIECFLTLEYLFLNNLSREEQLFRYKLWRVSGFMSRQNHVGKLAQNHINKLEKEQKIIAELKEDIKKSPYYVSLKKNDLWKLDKYGLPRVISWSNLIKKSIIKNKFENIYGLYSNYAHSEFISVMQINEGSQSKDDEFNKTNVASTLINIQLINCVTLILLKDKLICAKKVYDSLNISLKQSVEFWDLYARE